jgi:hypothetical protein
MRCLLLSFGAWYIECMVGCSSKTLAHLSIGLCLFFQHLLLDCFPACSYNFLPVHYLKTEQFRCRLSHSRPLNFAYGLEQICLVGYVIYERLKGTTWRQRREKAVLLYNIVWRFLCQYKLRQSCRHITTIWKLNIMLACGIIFMTLKSRTKLRSPWETVTKPFYQMLCSKLRSYVSEASGS